jgi:hypothetical protein
MRPIHGDEENICMRRGTFLVLWDLLTRTLHDSGPPKEVTPGNYEIIFRVDEAERRALHWLAGAIQRGVLDVMSDDLPELVAKEKRRIMTRPK